MNARANRRKIAADLSDRAVRPLLFRNYLVEAIAEGDKDETRRIVLPENSRVYGVDPKASLAGIDLDTGRGTPAGEIRARRTFENGTVRVVPITSLVRPHDLFWLKPGRTGARAKSKITIEVTSVRGIRLQDMTNADALREGVTHVPHKLLERTKHDLQPRNVFAVLWDDIYADTPWRSNPWVWVYRFRAYRHNVDSKALLRALRAAA